MTALRLVIAVVLVTLGGAMAVAAASSATHAAPSGDAIGGALVKTSRPNTAALRADGVVPGDTRTGTITVENDASAPAAFELAKSRVMDRPGPNGGRLSAKLDLRVEDVTSAGSPVTVYSGKLGAMPTLGLGRLAGGSSRSYRFSVRFPDGGTPPGPTSGDNAYMGSSLSLDFHWRATS